MADPTTKKTDVDDTSAPHGRDPETGAPLAPYGFKTDGTPRLSNRGRKASGSSGPKKAGPSGGSSRSATAKAKTQRQILLDLAETILTPVQGAMANPAVSDRIGEKRAAGILGATVIVDSFVPTYADQLIHLAQTKPALLAWTDRIEDNAPYFGLAILTVQMGKAIVGNIMQPDPRLAEAAKLKVQMRAAQMAAAIEEEAARMGVSLDAQPAPAAPEANVPQQPEGVADFSRLGQVA